MKLAAITFAAAMTATAACAECLDRPIADYDEWRAAVEACAKQDGQWLEDEFALPDYFERGLTPKQAYEEDEIARFDRENIDEQDAAE